MKATKFKVYEAANMPNPANYHENLLMCEKDVG